MNIVMTIHHPLDRSSGAAGSTMYLADAYAAMGHQVRILSFDNLPRFLSSLTKSIAFPWCVAARLFASKADIVDASTGDAWVWALGRRVFSPRTTVICRSVGLEHTVHQELIADPLRRDALSWKYGLYHGGFRLWEVARSLRSADGCIFLNGADRRYAIDRLRVSPDRTTVCLNGMPDPFLNIPVDFEECGPPRIAMVGSFIQRKGIDYALPALEAIMDRYPEVEVALLGTGVDEPTVRVAFPERHRSRLRIQASYDHQQLPALLKGYEIQLFTSLAEGFGKTLIECMACGLVPVTTNADGPMEVVQHNINGLVVPRKDSAAITAALGRLLDQPELRRELRKSAWRSAQAFSWRQSAENRLRFYEKVIAQRATGRPMSAIL